MTVTGEASQWTVVGENGTRKSRGFCPTCGAPVFIAFPDMPDVFVVSAASLDDPSRFRPAMVMWTAAGQAWDPLESEVPKFDKMPPAAD